MKSFSQFQEDKIVLEIFTKKNIKTGLFVEFGAWNGIHLSNCRLLAENLWSGFFIEGSLSRFKECRKNYENNEKITVLNKYINENYTLNDLVSENNIKGIDVLSIDIDGKDLTELKRLNLLKPKVIIIEYNPTIPFDVECEDHLGGNGSGFLSIEKFLSENNYELINFTPSNLIYIEKEFNGGEVKKVKFQELINKLKPIRFGFNNFGEMFFIENKKIVKKELYKFPTMKNYIVFQPIPRFIRALTDEDGKGFKLLKIVYSSIILLLLRPNLFFKKLFFKSKIK